MCSKSSVIQLGSEKSITEKNDSTETPRRRTNVDVVVKMVRRRQKSLQLIDLETHDRVRVCVQRSLSWNKRTNVLLFQELGAVCAHGKIIIQL